MIQTKKFKKNCILDLDKEFGIKRTTPMTFKKFFFTCITSTTNPERIAAWLGITKSECSEFKDTSTVIWQWMWATMIVLLIGVLVIIGIYGSGSLAVAIFGLCALPILILTMVLWYFMKRIDDGLLFHEMNYDY